MIDIQRLENRRKLNDIKKFFFMSVSPIPLTSLTPVPVVEDEEAAISMDVEPIRIPVIDFSSEWKAAEPCARSKRELVLAILENYPEWTADDLASSLGVTLHTARYQVMHARRFM